MRAGGARLLAFAWMAALPPASAQATVPERDGKGRDAAQFAREDSLRTAQAEARRREQGEARAVFVRALQLDESEEDCVAFDPGRSTCLVTVAEFNRRAAEWPPPLEKSRRGGAREFDVEELRRTVLHALLATRYLEQRLSQDPGKDSLERAWIESRTRRLRFMADRARTGDSALRAQYRARYEHDFRGREEPAVQVLGMGDSALADSLWRVFSDTTGGVDGIRRRRQAWRWRSPAPEDLPPGAQAAAAALRRGEVSRPWKAPYGYLLLRWVSVRREPEIPFEEALPALLAHAGRSSLGASNPESEVAAYFTRHRKEFRSPDTARFHVHLAPNSASRFTRGSRAVGTPRNGAAPIADSPAPEDADGLRQAKTATLFDLPPALQRQLERYLPGQPGEVLGPFPSAFGTWRLRVSATAPGGRLLSLREARPSILAALGKGPAGPSDARNLLSLDRQAWGLLAAHHLEARFAAEASARAVADPAGEASRRMAADKADWMRRYLDIRFIEWGGETSSGPMTGG